EPHGDRLLSPPREVGCRQVAALVEVEGEMPDLPERTPAELLLEDALGPAVERRAENEEGHDRHDDRAGEDLYVQRHPAAGRLDARRDGRQPTKERREQRLEVEEREESADEPGREPERPELEQLGDAGLREEPGPDAADGVADDRGEKEDPRDADREVEDRALERGGAGRVDLVGPAERLVPASLDVPEPEQREEKRPERAGDRDLPGIADEDPAELGRVEQPAEERVGQPEAPPGRHRDDRGREDRAPEL